MGKETKVMMERMDIQVPMAGQVGLAPGMEYYYPNLKKHFIRSQHEIKKFYDKIFNTKVTYL